MITIRQIEKLWSARQYRKLMHQLLVLRPEASIRLEMDLGHSVPVAAMTVLRLEELNQSHTDICQRFVRLIICSQDPDGGWGDPLTSAICLRALMCCGGEGVSIDRGIQFFAQLQKDEGIWPRIALRRTEADAFVSAFILYQLGNDVRFRAAVRMDDAMNWFEAHASQLDPDMRRLWNAIMLRSGRKAARRREWAAA